MEKRFVAEGGVEVTDGLLDEWAQPWENDEMPGTSAGFVPGLLMERERKARWPEGYREDVYGCLKDNSFRAPDEMDSALDGALSSFA